MFRTITAKYPGTCARCKGTIYKGDTIRYGGPGRTYHFAAKCAASQDTRDADIDASAAAFVLDNQRMADDRDADITREYR